MKEKFTSAEFKEMIERTLVNEFNKDLSSANYDDIYKASAFCVRRIMSEKHKLFSSRANGQGKKKVYYLCIEFLMGRSLKTSLFNLGLNEVAEKAWSEMGLNIERLYDCEPDAGLGNGGLGRLAACYLDGLAADSYYGGGYSILYEYGMFKQKIVNGWQTEQPDKLAAGRRSMAQSPPEPVRRGQVRRSDKGFLAGRLSPYNSHRLHIGNSRTLRYVCFRLRLTGRFKAQALGSKAPVY